MKRHEDSRNTPTRIRDLVLYPNWERLNYSVGFVGKRGSLCEKNKIGFLSLHLNMKDEL